MSLLWQLFQAKYKIKIKIIITELFVKIQIPR